MNAVADKTVEFVLQGQLTEGVNGGYQAIVAVDLEIPVVFAVFHAGSNETDQPDHTEDVVGMLMGHEQMMDADNRSSYPPESAGCRCRRRHRP